jgi:hypothetical protein
MQIPDSVNPEELQSLLSSLMGLDKRLPTPAFLQDFAMGDAAKEQGVFDLAFLLHMIMTRASELDLLGLIHVLNGASFLTDKLHREMIQARNHAARQFDDVYKEAVQHLGEVVPKDVARKQVLGRLERQIAAAAHASSILEDLSMSMTGAIYHGLANPPGERPTRDSTFFVSHELLGWLGITPEQYEAHYKSVAERMDSEDES